MTPQLVFASAAGGSAFMAELAEVVADAVRTVGGRAVTHVGPLPEPDPNTVYVVVPHEYLVVTPPDSRPTPRQLARTIGLCVEHPGTATFEVSAALVAGLAAAVDINAASTAELTRRGIRAHRFVLGYSPLWDAWGGDPDHQRDVDVAYLGTAERRRSLLLGPAAAALSGARLRWLTPPHEPMVRSRPDFLMGADKHRFMAGSRVLLNLHRERSTALEWVRYLEAACNGCVVITEPSSGIEPLRPGHDLLIGAGRRIGDLAAAVLADPDLERSIRASAYETVRQGLDMAGSARDLVDLADHVASQARAAGGPAVAGPSTNGHARRRAGGNAAAPVEAPAVDPPRDVDPPLAVDTPLWDSAAAPGRAGQDITQWDRFRAGLAVARLNAGRRAARGSRLVPASTPFGPSGTPTTDVQVMVVRRPGDPAADGLLADLAVGSLLPVSVLLVEDGSPGPARLVTTCDVLEHRAPAGVGWSRNRLLDHVTAGRVLVLEADLRADRHLLRRLTQSTAPLAHCPVADPVAGLVGALPAEPRRLLVEPYLGSGYLAETEVVRALGGWCENPWCDDLVDHLFWSAVAAAGVRTELVQHPLLRRANRPPGDGWAVGVGTRPIDLDPSTVWTAANGELRRRGAGVAGSAA